MKTRKVALLGARLHYSSGIASASFGYTYEDAQGDNERIEVRSNNECSSRTLEHFRKMKPEFGIVVYTGDGRPLRAFVADNEVTALLVGHKQAGIDEAKRTYPFVVIWKKYREYPFAVIHTFDTAFYGDISKLQRPSGFYNHRVRRKVTS